VPTFSGRRLRYAGRLGETRGVRRSDCCLGRRWGHRRGDGWRWARRSVPNVAIWPPRAIVAAIGPLVLARVVDRADDPSIQDRFRRLLHFAAAYFTACDV